MRLGGVTSYAVVGVGVVVCAAVVLVRRRDLVLGGLLGAAGTSWLLPRLTIAGFSILFVHRALLGHALVHRSARGHLRRRVVHWWVGVALVGLYVVCVNVRLAINPVVVGTAGFVVILAAAPTNRRALQVALGAIAAMFAIAVVGPRTSWFTNAEKLTAYDLAVFVVALSLCADRLTAGHASRVVELGRSGRLVAGSGSRSDLTVGFGDGAGGFRSFEGAAVVPGADQRCIRFDLGTELGPAIIVHDDPSLDDPVVRRDLESGLRVLALNVALTRQLEEQGADVARSQERLEASDERAAASVASDVESRVITHLDRVASLLDGTQAAGRPSEATMRLLMDIRNELSLLASGRDPIDVGAGLAAALRTLAHESRLPVDLAIGGDCSDPAYTRALYLVACEALTNSAKHSHAERAFLGLRGAGEWLELVVADDGIGGASIGSTGGLFNVRERVRALGGDVSLREQAAGGTVLTAHLPLADTAERRRQPASMTLVKGRT